MHSSAIKRAHGYIWGLLSEYTFIVNLKLTPHYHENKESEKLPSQLGIKITGKLTKTQKSYTNLRHSHNKRKITCTLKR